MGGSKGSSSWDSAPGNWLTLAQGSDVLNHAHGDSLRAKRDSAMLAMLLGCGLRRSELADLEIDEVQTRQGHWAIVDLIGKGGRIRTVPIPQWAKDALDVRISAAIDRAAIGDSWFSEAPRARFTWVLGGFRLGQVGVPRMKEESQ